MSLASWRVARRARTSISIAIAISILAGFAVLTRLPDAEAAAATPIAQHLAVPSYIHPLADPGAWTRLVASKPGTVGISMANVLNGPDFEPKPEWAAVIAQAHASGQRVLGYVDSGYFGTTGQRTRAGSTRTQDWTAQIERDITAWYAFYGANIDGIFFDQGQNACGPTPGSNEYADLYSEINQYVKRSHPGSLTVVNPGTGLPQCYENTADVLLTFESDYAAYIGQNANPVLNYKPLDWTPLDPNKIWHLIYGASQAQVPDAIQKSQERGAGWVYVTDDVMVNPWDTLPAAPYWDLEQSLITSPPPVGSPGPSTPLVTITQTTATSVSLAWTTATPSTTPVLGFDIFDGATWIESTRGDSASWTIADLDPSTSHSFTVVARDALGARSSASAPAITTTAPVDASPPAVPVGLTASATDYTTTQLSWQPSTDAEGPISGYAVQLAGQDILSLPATATSVLVSELPSATTTTFTVAAVDASGHRSAVSEPVSATTLALPGGKTIVDPTVVQARDTIAYQAQFLVPFSFRRVFIVTGGTDPCWQSNTVDRLCVSYVIENGSLQKYAGDGVNWTWTKVRDVEPTINGYSYTWTISPADIGSPPSHKALFNAEGYAPLTYTDVPIVAYAAGALLPGERIGGGNPSGYAVCSCNGNDIDPLTGELSVVKRDIAAQRSGTLARTLTRTYSSQRTALRGRFGFGWIDSYDLQLAVTPQGAGSVVSIRQENGSYVYFTGLGDGTYAPMSSFDATLVALPDGSWTFVRKGVATFRFDATGRLAAKSSRDETLTLAYDEAGLLRTVQSGSGDRLRFDYQGFLVSSVTDVRGRRLTYNYDANGDLRSVDDSASGTTSYEYDQHRLTKLAGTDRRSNTYTYDAEGRIRTRLDERRLLFTYDYAVDPVSLTGSSTITTGTWKDVTRSVFEGGDLVSTTYDWGTAIATTVKLENDPLTHAATKMIDPDGSISLQPYEDDHLDCAWW